MTRPKDIMRDSGGFTLVELLVVMALLIIVLVISAGSFNTILKNSIRVFKSEESNIEGVVGLEMLRHDLQQAGYGLYTETGPSYTEAIDTLPALNNDAPNNVPRPLVFIDNLDGVQSVDSYTPLAGSDYLSIKGTSANTATVAQKWTFLNITSTHVRANTWASGSENFSPTDNVVVLQKQFGAPPKSSLMNSPSGNFYYTYNSGTTGFANLSTAMNGMYTVYGINSMTVPQFPFNRIDYFVATPPAATGMPRFCAPGTGVLYKATLNNQASGASGKLNYIPVMDCVLDMQVVLGWDTDGDGVIDTWTGASGVQNQGPGGRQDATLGNTQNNSLATTSNIRSNLKMVKVYLLAQNGAKDSNYLSQTPLKLYDEASLTQPNGIALTPAQLNYRWKLYRIVVRPKNLLANQ